jgi:hypothetical protein
MKGMKAVIMFLIQCSMCLAGLGLCLLAATVIALLAGHHAISNSMAEVLFPGIFVVWFPTVLVSGVMVRGARQRDFWKVALSGCPKWMRSTLYTAIGLGAASFLYFVVLSGNRKNLPLVLFGGGHMLIFYGVAFCVLYSASSKADLLDRRRCPSGHDVSPLDSFCPNCGAHLVR